MVCVGWLVCLLLAVCKQKEKVEPEGYLAFLRRELAAS